MHEGRRQWNGSAVAWAKDLKRRGEGPTSACCKLEERVTANSVTSH